jgi:hypothetical protein
MKTTSQNAGMYAPPAADGPKKTTDLRYAAGSLHLVVEDLSGAASPREEIDLVRDTRARRVDEIDDRMVMLARQLDDPDDLFHGPRAPRTRFDRRIVRHHGNRPIVDRAYPGDDAVGRQIAGERVAEKPLLDEAVH